MGKAAYGFTSSIDGFIAGPGHDMEWMSAAEPLAEGSTRRMAERVAVIISGRRGYDAALAQRDERDGLTAEPYGGAWSGTVCGEAVCRRDRHQPHRIDSLPVKMPCSSSPVSAATMGLMHV